MTYRGMSNQLTKSLVLHIIGQKKRYCYKAEWSEYSDGSNGTQLASVVRTDIKK
jgi:hypothetical protein